MKGWLVGAVSAAALCAQTPNTPSRAIVNQYCLGCHNDKLKSGGFSWTKLDLAHPEAAIR